MNAEQQAAVERMRQASQRYSGPVTVSSINAQQILSLITSLEEDSKRLDWMDKYEAFANDHGKLAFTVCEIPPFTQRKDKDLRQAIDAAMKGVV